MRVESGRVGKGTGVFVTVGVNKGGTVGDNCAWTVKAADVIIAGGICWEEGRLHARTAAIITMPASTVENFRMISSDQSCLEILMQSVKLHTPVLSYLPTSTKAYY
jgi:hypothetical protein